MGYSLNPELVHRRKHLFQLLERGIETTWKIKGNLIDTNKYAYMLRETLYIASQYPKEFPGLADAAKEWTIKVVEPGIIKSIPKQHKTSVVIHGLEPQGRPVPLEGPRDAAAVVKAWRDHLPSSDPLHFTKVSFGEIELTKVWEFCQKNKPKLMMLVDEDNRTLTISHHEIGMDDFSWTPPEPPEPEEKFNI